MRLLTIALLVLFFTVVGMVFSYIADDRGLILWLIFGLGAFLASRRYLSTTVPALQLGEPS